MQRAKQNGSPNHHRVGRGSIHNRIAVPTTSQVLEDTEQTIRRHHVRDILDAVLRRHFPVAHLRDLQERLTHDGRQLIELFARFGYSDYPSTKAKDPLTYTAPFIKIRTSKKSVNEGSKNAIWSMLL